MRNSVPTIFSFTLKPTGVFDKLNIYLTEVFEFRHLVYSFVGRNNSDQPHFACSEKVGEDDSSVDFIGDTNDLLHHSLEDLIDVGRVLLVVGNQRAKLAACTSISPLFGARAVDWLVRSVEDLHLL